MQKNGGDRYVVSLTRPAMAVTNSVGSTGLGTNILYPAENARARPPQSEHTRSKQPRGPYYLVPSLFILAISE
jgi:hypothetical protein